MSGKTIRFGVVGVCGGWGRGQGMAKTISNVPGCTVEALCCSGWAVIGLLLFHASAPGTIIRMHKATPTKWRIAASRCARCTAAVWSR